MRKKIVIALGGNALGNSPSEQLELVKVTAKNIVDLIKILPSFDSKLPSTDLKCLFSGETSILWRFKQSLKLLNLLGKENTQQQLHLQATSSTKHQK